MFMGFRATLCHSRVDLVFAPTAVGERGGALSSEGGGFFCSMRGGEVTFLSLILTILSNCYSFRLLN